MSSDTPQKAARRRYNASPKGRASHARYRETPRGREAQRLAKAKWNRDNKEAVAAASRARKREQAERIDTIKLERGCIDCGFNSHPAALDFDHRDGELKVANVSRLIGATWRRIEAEIAKCDVRCANCHRIRTAEVARR